MSKNSLMELRNEFNKQDLFLVTLPIIVISLFQLQPESFQKRFILQYTNVQFPDIFAHAYIHNGFKHFFANLTSYLIVTPFLYALSLWGDWRKRLRRSLILVFLLIPVLVGLLDSLILPPDFLTGQGFSGINAALIGLLPWPIFAYLHTKTEGVIELENATLLYSLGAIVLVLSAARYTTDVLLAIPLIVVLVLISVLTGGITVNQGVASEVVYLWRNLPTIEFAILGVSIMLFLISPIPLLEFTVRNGAGTNIWGHMFGYILGFVLGSLAAVEFNPRKFE